MSESMRYDSIAQRYATDRFRVVRSGQGVVAARQVMALHADGTLVKYDSANSATDSFYGINLREVDATSSAVPADVVVWAREWDPSNLVFENPSDSWGMLLSGVPFTEIARKKRIYFKTKNPAEGLVVSSESESGSSGESESGSS